ncbi:MAG: AAA family ATPase [Candidatus Latescibacterota bacterium]
MDRFILQHLRQWRARASRKPLVIRGARQVGKTYAVRLFAAESFERLLEINLERHPDVAAHFASNDPRRTLGLLELQFGMRIEPGSTLLFLDEIQAAPSILASLRYFCEELPALHIVAAGSLLELALAEPSFSVPVGRLEYAFLGPMQFEEFLLAAGKSRLAEFLAGLTMNDTVPPPIHRQLLELLRTFLVTGGMPEAVQTFLTTGSWRECEAVKQGLIATLQDDFNKYSGRFPGQRLQLLLKQVPRLLGDKFQYVQVDRAARAADLARGLRLLTQARVVYPVHQTSASGIPLGATVNERIFKVLFLDVGLATTFLGLNLLDFERAADIMLVNRGAVCEQYVGQHLLWSLPWYQPPELHYWLREKRTSAAEVDYVIAEGQVIVPVEVKAGKGGTLRSLHLFLREKGSTLGLRLNSDPPSLLNAQTALPDGDNKAYQLLSLPLYLAGQCRRLLREHLG